MAHERICILDGTKYKYCRHCAQYNPRETWRNIFCSENCKKVYETLADFEYQRKSAEEAKEVLSSCDLQKKDRYNDKHQEMVKAIMRKRRKSSPKKEEHEDE